MSYQVLARKWRPRRFADVVGQAHVVRALVNALESDRLHHAFLFSGTRGVGKTTIARILAKALNCEQGVSAEPCGACPTCQAVDEGRFVDLIEVDAASRTKVDDTRELLDNVQYAPTRGRYKVYLIDEVHMLSGHSFNALLKTLEEPPPHVKFLLATTDPQKLPVTVLSRCLQFHLKPLPGEQIGAQLARILEAEGVAHEAPALALLARAADGSLRDALSLLDQAIAHGGGKVESAAVRDMLGTLERGHLHALLDALADQDAQAALEAVDALAQRTPDYAGALDELLLALYHIALAQGVPGALAAKGVEDEHLQALAGRLAPEDVQLYYQVGLIAKRDLPLAPDPRSGFEMALLRMLAFRPAEAQAPAGAPAPVPAPARRPEPAAAAAGGDAGPAPEALPLPTPENWHQVIGRVGVSGLLKELLAHTVLEACDEARIELVLDAAHEHLTSREREKNLEAALGSAFGRPLKLRLRVEAPGAETPARKRQREALERQRAAEDAIQNDPNVQTVLERFNAQLNPATIRPKEASD